MPNSASVRFKNKWQMEHFLLVVSAKTKCKSLNHFKNNFGNAIVTEQVV